MTRKKEKLELELERPSLWQESIQELTRRCFIPPLSVSPSIFLLLSPLFIPSLSKYGESTGDQKDTLCIHSTLEWRVSRSFLKEERGKYPPVQTKKNGKRRIPGDGDSEATHTDATHRYTVKSFIFHDLDRKKWGDRNAKMQVNSVSLFPRVLYHLYQLRKRISAAGLPKIT